MANKPAKDQAEEMVNNTCFVIMPISDQDGYDKGHFDKVYEDIIKVACEKAGFKAVRGDEVKQTNLIHLDILQKLLASPMAICDMSARNPNVLFELGLRQAFDKPTVLIQEEGTPPIFDISPLRYTEYKRELKYRDVLDAQARITHAIKATKEASEKGEGVNSIVSLLSLSSPATLKETSDNDTVRMMQVIMAEINDLRSDIRKSESKKFSVTRMDSSTVDDYLFANEFKRGIGKLDRLLKDEKKNEARILYNNLYDAFRLHLENINDPIALREIQAAWFDASEAYKKLSDS